MASRIHPADQKGLQGDRVEPLKAEHKQKPLRNDWWQAGLGRPGKNSVKIREKWTEVWDMTEILIIISFSQP